MRIRYADVAATLALVMAGGGTAYAVTMAPPNSVNTAAIVNGAVTAPKIAAEAVTSSKIAPSSVTRSKLLNDAVSSAKIANGSVTAADIAGTDVSGTISVSLSAHSCGKITLSVAGAVPGDMVMMAFTGATTPANFIVGPGRVTSADHAEMIACNPSASNVSFTNQGVRMMTFR